jgi:hypothetical protein
MHSTTTMTLLNRYSRECSDSEWWSTFLSQWNFGRARDATIDKAEDTELQQKVRYFA